MLAGCSEGPPATKPNSPPVAAATAPGDLTYHDVLQKGEIVHQVGMADAGQVWVGTHSGIYYSASNQLWASLSEELEDDVTGWYVDPDNPRHIYVGGNGVVKRTEDGGETWNDASGGLPSPPDVRGLAGVRENGQLILYAAIAGEGIYRREGSGTWEKWLPLDQEVYAIAYHPAEQRLYVATQYGLLYSQGERWETEPVEAQQINSLTVDEASGQLYLATEQGILQRRDGAWQVLDAAAPERLVVIAKGWGDIKLVGIGESALVYKLHGDTWTQWEGGQP